METTTTEERRDVLERMMRKAAQSWRTKFQEEEQRGRPSEPPRRGSITPKKEEWND